MFHRLMALARANGVEFGLKLSNTFPVDVKADELPSEEMYMSGRALYPLTIEMAARMAREFDGRLRLSYSGGADYFKNLRMAERGMPRLKLSLPTYLAKFTATSSPFSLSTGLPLEPCTVAMS